MTIFGESAGGGSVMVHLTSPLPIMPGWNYTVRLYRPRPEVVDGRRKFTAAQPAM